MSLALVVEAMNKASRAIKSLLEHRSSKPIDHPDKSITPAKIDSINDAADGYALTYDSASGRFKWSVGAGGVTKLSQLEIDVDKDWMGHRIRNLGAPVEASDALRLSELLSHAVATPIDHPDGSVTRAKLEYPTVDVSLGYLAIIGKARDEAVMTGNVGLLTIDVFTDKAIEAYIASKDCGGVVARQSDRYNTYFAWLNMPAAAADFKVSKFVNGAETVLGYEAVNLTTDVYLLKLSCIGSTLKGYRNDMTTPKVTVTDTSFSSGRFGSIAGAGGWTYFGAPCGAYLRAPSSPSQRPIYYLEIPVVGSGTPDDPFRPQMPELVEWEWSLNPLAKKKYDILKARGFTEEEIELFAPEVLSCRVNRLALTHSSLIKTDRTTGRPTEYVAIVRIFEQPDRQSHLHSIDKCLDALRSVKGVRRLTRDEAIKRAKQLDPDLADVDLLPIKPTDLNFKKAIKDYVAHRKGLGVREELIDEKLMEQYLQEDKGW
ncbi:MAG: hypothetical protein QXU69_08585 [Thermofilaceae archaeon]